MNDVRITITTSDYAEYGYTVTTSWPGQPGETLEAESLDDASQIAAQWVQRAINAHYNVKIQNVN